MSALPPKADIGIQSRNVRFVPKADSCTATINASLGEVLTSFRQWLWGPKGLRNVTLATLDHRRGAGSTT